MLQVNVNKKERSRLGWKDRKRPSKRAIRQKIRRFLNADQDIRFSIQFNLTRNSRLRMKKFFRRLGFHLFAKESCRKRVVEGIVQRTEWNYESVKFLRYLKKYPFVVYANDKAGVFYRNNIETEIRRRLIRLIEQGKLFHENSEFLHVCIIGDKGI